MDKPRRKKRISIQANLLSSPPFKVPPILSWSQELVKLQGRIPGHMEI